MEYVAGIAGLIFVIAGFRAVDRIHHDDLWIGAGILSGVAFAVLCVITLQVLSNR